MQFGRSTHFHRRTNPLLGIVFVFGLVAVRSALAQPFDYTPRDLLAGFRQTGGVNEFLVDLGASSNYFNAQPGTSWTITNFVPAQLKAAFGDAIAGVQWSVAGCVTPADGGAPGIPTATLWMTRPRSDASTQTTPWNRNSNFSQSQVGTRVANLGFSGEILSNRKPADPLNNTVTALIEPAGDSDAYSFYVTALGNFASFQGMVENNTGDPFSQPVRSDLYELRPATPSQPGRYLGYFELSPDGTMRFQAAETSLPGGIPRPNIQSIARAGTMTMISFTTTNDPTVIYQLRATNNAGFATPLTNWPPSGATITGNGQVRTLQDDSSDPERIYGISARR